MNTGFVVPNAIFFFFFGSWISGTNLVRYIIIVKSKAIFRKRTRFCA